MSGHPLGPQKSRVPASIRDAGLANEYLRRIRDGWDYCGCPDHVGGRWVLASRMATSTVATCALCYRRRDRVRAQRRRAGP